MKSRKIRDKHSARVTETARAQTSLDVGLFGMIWTSLPLIVAAALVLRSGFAFDYVRQNSRQALATLPFLQESGNIAASLATGHGFSSPFRVDTGPTAWMPPVYPWLLSEIFRVFGVRTYDSFLAATGLNILCSVLTCLPIYFAGRRMGGASIATSAAWLWAVFPNAILNTFESMWDASVGTLLAAMVLWAALALEKSERWVSWFAYGLLWGIALLTNATLVALLPLLLGWLVHRRRMRHERTSTRPTSLNNSLMLPALALAIALLCCVPWTARNYRVFHRFVPLRSTLGLQLWIGNNENPQEAWKEELHPIFNSAERRRYVQMGEIDYMNEKLRDGIRFMATHPGRDILQFMDRFIATWTGGTPSPVQDFIRTPGIWFRSIVVFNVLLAIGTAVGILVLWRRRNAYLFPVAVFPLIFPWAYYLTLFVPRYRLPVDPAVILLSAVTLSVIFHRQESVMDELHL